MNTKTIKKNRKRLSSREKREKLTKRRLRNKMEGGVGKARARQRKRKGEKRRRNEQISNQNDIIKNNKMTPDQKGWVKFINDVYYVDYEHYLYAAKIVTQVEKEIEKIEEGSTVSIDIKLPELSKLNQLQQYITNFKVPKDMQSYVSSIPSPVELVKLDTSLKIIDKQNRINDLLEHVVLEKYVDLPMLSHILDNNLDVKGVKSLNNNINFKLKPVELVEFSKIIHAVNKSDAPMGSISDIQVLAPTQLELLQLNEAFRIIHKQEAERIAREGAIRIAKKAEREELAKKVKNTEGYIDQINELFAKGDYEGAERKIKETNSFIQENLENQGYPDLVDQVNELSSKVNKHNNIKGLLYSAQDSFNSENYDEALKNLEEANKIIDDGDGNDIQQGLVDRKKSLLQQVQNKQKSINAQIAKIKIDAEKKENAAIGKLEAAQNLFNSKNYGKSIEKFNDAIKSLEQTAIFIRDNNVKGNFTVGKLLVDARNEKGNAQKANDANNLINGAEKEIREQNYDGAIKKLEESKKIIKDNNLNDHGDLLNNVDKLQEEAGDYKKISSLKDNFNKLKGRMFEMDAVQMEDKQIFETHLTGMKDITDQLDSIRYGRDEIKNITEEISKYINFINSVVIPLYKGSKITKSINMEVDLVNELPQDFVDKLRTIGISPNKEFFEGINNLIDKLLKIFEGIGPTTGNRQTDRRSRNINNFKQECRNLRYIFETILFLLTNKREYNNPNDTTLVERNSNIIKIFRKIKDTSIKDHIEDIFTSNLTLLKEIIQSSLTINSRTENLSNINPNRLKKLDLHKLSPTQSLPGQVPVEG